MENSTNLTTVKSRWSVSTQESRIYLNLYFNTLEAVKELYNKKNARGLTISGESIWLNDSVCQINLKDLATSLRDVEEIVLSDGYIKDWQEFRLFSQLHTLSFGEANIINKENMEKFYPQIDLLWFPNLVEFSSWRNIKFIKNMGVAKIKYLWLNNKFSTKDLTKIDFPPTIEELRLGYSPIRSLEGIEKLINLKILGLTMLNKIEDLTILDNLPNLHSISIQGCRSINYESLKNRNLRSIDIYVETEHSKNKLPSLHFLRNLPNLETVSLRCPIIDGDMTPLLDLPNLKKVSLTDKKNYSHTLKQIYEIKNLFD